VPAQNGGIAANMPGGKESSLSRLSLLLLQSWNVSARISLSPAAGMFRPRKK
jgi:hypothetical protein